MFHSSWAHLLLIQLLLVDITMRTQVFLPVYANSMSSNSFLSRELLNNYLGLAIILGYWMHKQDAVEECKPLIDSSFRVFVARRWILSHLRSHSFQEVYGHPMYAVVHTVHTVHRITESVLSGPVWYGSMLPKKVCTTARHTAPAGGTLNLIFSPSFVRT